MPTLYQVVSFDTPNIPGILLCTDIAKIHNYRKKKSLYNSNKWIPYPCRVNRKYYGAGCVSFISMMIKHSNKNQMIKIDCSKFIDYVK